MKKSFMFLMLLVLGVFLVGCDFNFKGTNEEMDKNNPIVGMTKTVINIDNTNYSDYFDIDFVDMMISINGTLDFAIYDNCVMKYSHQNPGDNSIKIEEVKLNKGGYYKAYAYNAKIIEITGTATYWF